MIEVSDNRYEQLILTDTIVRLMMEGAYFGDKELDTIRTIYDRYEAKSGETCAPYNGGKHMMMDTGWR